MPSFRKNVRGQHRSCSRLPQCGFAPVADCHVALPNAVVSRRYLLKQNTAALCAAFPNKFMRFTQNDEEKRAAIESGQHIESSEWATKRSLSKYIIHVRCQEKSCVCQVSLRCACIPMKDAGSLNDRYVMHRISEQVLLAEKHALAIDSRGNPTQGQHLAISAEDHRCIYQTRFAEYYELIA